MNKGGWYAAVVVRLIGAWLAAASVVWFVAGLAVLLFALAMGWDQRRWDLGYGWSVAGVVIIGSLVGIPGFFLSIIVIATCQHLMDEHLWHSGLRRGIATVHDLRPGYTGSNSATQDLTCRLEIRVVGMETISADYRADIGPLDAPRLVEGAAFAGEISPAFPDRYACGCWQTRMPVSRPDATATSGQSDQSGHESRSCDRLRAPPGL